MSNALVGLSLDPPALSEKLEYRHAMERWVKTIATLAKAGNSQAVCLSAVMAEVVMASLPPELNAMVTTRVAQGEINLDAGTFGGQLKAVQSIVKLIASDSPTEHVDRIANAYAEVSECKRKKGEAVKIYATRFYSKAQTYLRIAGGDESDAGGLVLALVFVENALLTPETRQQVKLQLQQAAILSVREQGQYVRDGTAVLTDGEVLGNVSSDEHNGSDEEDVRPRGVTGRASREYVVPDGLFEVKGKAAVFTLADVYHTFQCMGSGDIAVKNEVWGGASSSKDTNHLQAQVDKLANLNKSLMSNLRLQPASQNTEAPVRRIRCFGCGKLGHRRSECPEGDRCTYCKKRGHVEAACFEKHGMLDKSPEEKQQFLSRVRGGRNQSQDGDKDADQRRGGEGSFGIPRAKNTPGEIFRRRRSSN